MVDWPTLKYPRYIALWHSLRDGSGVPLLSHYFDRAPADIQPWMGIVDINSDEHQPMRLMGTSLSDYFGGDATGRNFLALQSRQTEPVFRRAHQVIPRIPCGALFRGTSSTSRSRNVDMYGLALPFRTGNGFCVGWCMHAIAEIGYTETGLSVTETSAIRWIDLGQGVPA